MGLGVFLRLDLRLRLAVPRSLIRLLPVISISDDAAGEGERGMNGGGAMGRVRAAAQRRANGSLWGLMAEFATAAELARSGLRGAPRVMRVEAIRSRSRSKAWPTRWASRATTSRPSRFAGALTGGLSGYLMQWYSAVVDLLLNIGGRPLNSWPMFVPVTSARRCWAARWQRSSRSSSATGCPTCRTRCSRRRTSTSRCATASSSACAPTIPAFDEQRCAAWLDARRPLKRVEVRR
ncbi:MAG: quinol:electron acceptor oxidoreductase subunit ActD [Rubrivivax sp.]